MNPEADWFFNKGTQWQEAYGQLREIALGTGLTEELKWGCPCYTYKGKNVVLIHGFNNYCALLFHKGALLKDPKNILIQQTKNVQSARQIRFTSLDEIIKQKAILETYIKAAIGVERSGAKVDYKKAEDYPMPEEFKAYLGQDRVLDKAFRALTPGRQKAYLFHFGQAKKSETRIARIQKYIPKILAGKGLED